MAKVSKEELKSLKQVGGSPIAALLILAGVGLVAGTIVLLTDPKKAKEGDAKNAAKEGVAATDAVAATQDVKATGGAKITRVVVDDLKSGSDPLTLLDDNLNGGWVREKNEYFHYQMVKSLEGRNVVLIRKFVKA